MKEDGMENIIDRHLIALVDGGLNALPEAIVPAMAGPKLEPDEGCNSWLPIASKVTDVEIEAFESRIGFQFPVSYRQFLKYKHFYNLQIGECSFCRHPVGVWRSALSEMIYEGYPTEFLIEKGRIPFADWSDWGLLCFDTTSGSSSQDYPIVLWDHEVAYEFENKYADFVSMIEALDKESMEDEKV